MVTDLIAETQTERKQMLQQAFRATQVAPELGIAGATGLVIPITPARRHTLFSETLLEMSSTRPQRRTADLFMSMLFHTLVLLALLLPPLYFTNTIDLRQFSQTFLVTPPPPPPPPPAPTAAVVEGPRPEARVRECWKTRRTDLHPQPSCPDQRSSARIGSL